MSDGILAFDDLDLRAAVVAAFTGLRGGSGAVNDLYIVDPAGPGAGTRPQVSREHLQIEGRVIGSQTSPFVFKLRSG